MSGPVAALRRSWALATTATLSPRLGWQQAGLLRRLLALLLPVAVCGVIYADRRVNPNGPYGVRPDLYLPLRGAPFVFAVLLHAFIRVLRPYRSLPAPREARLRHGCAALAASVGLSYLALSPLLDYAGRSAQAPLVLVQVLSPTALAAGAAALAALSGLWGVIAALMRVYSGPERPDGPS